MNLVAILIISLSFAFFPPPLLSFEDSVLVLFVTDTEDRPITNITITCTGDCSQARSVQGKARIKLPPQTRSGESVTLQIVKLSNDPDWVLISPWNNQVIVPSFENRAGNAIQIVVGKRGGKQILSSGKALQAITAKIVSNVGTKIDKRFSDLDKQNSINDRHDVLKQQADNYGLTPEEIDQAIREWGSKAKDPYEQGLVALYSQKYSESSRLLFESSRLRKTSLLWATFDYSNSLRFLGQSLMQEKRYAEAIKIFDELLQVKNYEDRIYGEVVSELSFARRYEDAERYVKKRMELAEIAKNVDLIASALIQFGYIYLNQRRYEEADVIYARLLKVASECKECIFKVSSGFMDAAFHYKRIKQWDKAEFYFKESIKLYQQHYRPNHEMLSDLYSSLAVISYEQANYIESEAWYKRAVDIFKLNPENKYHLDHNLWQLGQFYRNQKRYKEAESLFTEHLFFKQNKFGKDHSETVSPMRFLARTYREMKKYPESEALFKQAVVIAEKTLASDSEHLGVLLLDYGLLYKETNRYSDAEAIFKRAIPILDDCEICGNREVELLTEYADLLRKLNRPEEAKDIELKAQKKKNK